MLEKIPNVSLIEIKAHRNKNIIYQLTISIFIILIILYKYYYKFVIIF
jgi:hypothetical protein